jgi:nicotinamide riboside kinase
MFKIVLTGPESCGKSTLAEQLSAQLHVPLVMEYARAYLMGKLQHAIAKSGGGRRELATAAPPQYNLTDLEKIARGQVHLEQQAFLETTTCIVADTDLLTMKIWSEEKFSHCPDWIFEKLNQPSPALYLLCSPEGIAWETDPLRENPADRARLFDLYERDLQFFKKDFVVLRGDKKARFEAALVAIERIQNRQKTA